MTDKVAKDQVKQWLSHFEDQSAVYRTNNLLVLWGDDFAHRFADKTYGNLDTIMDAIEEHQDIYLEFKNTYHLKYSSIDKYLKSVQ